MSEKTVITYHEQFEKYDLGKNHPFQGDRFSNTMAYLKEQGILNSVNISTTKPKAATYSDILRVHDMSYLDYIIQLAREKKPYDVETPVTKEIIEAALLIAGGAMTCGETVFSGKTHQGISLGGGFHHAGRDYGGGFCIFNDIAVLVEYLRTKCGAKRFLILDYDVHFGNGTSDIYYKDDSVLHISLHQDPVSFYPETGFVWQNGKGKGKGYNVNVPLPAGTGDSTYIYALKQIFVPLAEEFNPEIILCNGGSDAHFADALGGLRLTVNGFYNISRLIKMTAEKTCNGKFVLMIGSGYNSKVLPLCWYALVAGAIGLDSINVKEPYTLPNELPHCRRVVNETIDELRKLLKAQWSCFRDR